MKSKKTMIVFIFSYFFFYVNAFDFFNDYIFDFTYLTILLIVCSTLHCMSINNGRNKYFKIFVFYIVNLAYFVKFYVIVDVSWVNYNLIYQRVLMSPRLDSYLGIENLIYTFKYMVLMYASCVASFIFNDFFSKKRKEITCKVVIKLRAFYLSLVVAISLSLSTTIFRLKLAETSFEPILIILNTYVVPLFFCLLITLAVYKSQTNVKRTGSGLLLPRTVSIIFIFCGLIQFLLIGSKLFIILPVLFTLCISLHNRITIIPSKLFLVLPCLLLAYPLLNMYREALLSGIESPIFHSLSIWFNSEISVFRLAIYSILYRFIGVDSCLSLFSERNAQYSDYGITDLLFNQNSIAHIFTYDILNYEFTMGSATSIFGQVYFIFGNIALSCLVIFVVFITLDRFILYLNSSDNVFLKSLGAYLFIFSILYINEGFIFTNFKYQVFSLVIYFVFTLFFERNKRTYGKW